MFSDNNLLLVEWKHHKEGAARVVWVVIAGLWRVGLTEEERRSLLKPKLAYEELLLRLLLDVSLEWDETFSSFPSAKSSTRQ